MNNYSISIAQPKTLDQINAAHSASFNTVLFWVLLVSGIIIGIFLFMRFFLPLTAMYIGYLGKMVKKGMSDN